MLRQRSLRRHVQYRKGLPSSSGAARHKLREIIPINVPQRACCAQARTPEIGQIVDVTSTQSLCRKQSSVFHAKSNSFGYIQRMNRSMVFGIIAAAMASFSWSLSFIVPFVIGDYSLFDFTLVEFVISGILSVGLLWQNALAVRKLTLKDWAVGCFLGLIGYVGYFIAVMAAAIYAGPVIAQAFLGLVPVVLGIAGNLRDQTVAWSSLTLPLVLAAVGLLLVNCSGLVHAGGVHSKSLALGIPLAILAVTFWTSFGLLNASALARRPEMNVGVWTALIMVGAGMSMLAFFPIGFSLRLFEIPRLGLHWNIAGPLIMWATGLAILANFGGASAWTFASKRLPVALAAQMVTMEPISAAILGLLVHQRWPSAMEALGVIFLLVGVIIAIRIFSKAAVLQPDYAAA